MNSSNRSGACGPTRFKAQGLDGSKFPQRPRLRTCGVSFGESLLRGGKNGFEMRGLFLSRDDADFDFPETGGFHPALQIALGESEPAVAIKLVRLLELVLRQIQDQQLAARRQDAM